MDRIAELRIIVDQPYSYLQKIKNASGKKIVGTVCSYAPEEVIQAAGALPVRLFGSGSGISRADLHLQSYCCSLVRGILEEALTGRLDLLDGMVFPHTCDSIQRLSDVWRLNVPQTFHADVVMPVKLDTPSAKQYLIDVLWKFRTELARSLNQEIHEDDLIKAIKLYNAIRGQLRRLTKLRSSNPQVLKGSDYHTIIRAAMIMERENYLEALSKIVAELEENAPRQEPSRGKRLVLSGGICNTPDLYDAIESAGGVVVGDDLCTGTRYFAGDLKEDLAPVDAMAQRYVERAVCPAKHTGLTDRGENLVRLVKESGAQGVVFMLLKFCDPHAFDYPYIKDMLDRENIPSLLLEMEEQTQTGGQLETRLETFTQIL